MKPKNKNLYHQSIALIANGKISNDCLISQKLKNYDHYIAVDGGLNHCHRLNIDPLILIGDLDSADPSLYSVFSHLKTLSFDRDKDLTDLDLAVQWAFEKTPSSVTIFGGFGLRIDHSLSNLIALSRYPEKLFLETEYEKIFAIRQFIEVKTYPGQMLSLIPINGPVEVISTSGLKWELKHQVLDKNFMGVSNVATELTVTLSIKSGDLLLSLHDKENHR